MASEASLGPSSASCSSSLKSSEDEDAAAVAEAEGLDCEPPPLPSVEGGLPPPPGHSSPMDAAAWTARRHPMLEDELISSLPRAEVNSQADMLPGRYAPRHMLPGYATTHATTLQPLPLHHAPATAPQLQHFCACNSPSPATAPHIQQIRKYTTTPPATTESAGVRPLHAQRQCPSKLSDGVADRSHGRCRSRPPLHPVGQMLSRPGIDSLLQRLT